MDRATLNTTRVTPYEFSSYFSQKPEFILEKNDKLTIHQINVNDFISLTVAPTSEARLAIFAKMIAHFSVELEFSGSISLGEFNISDYSWSLYPGDSGFLKISSRPITTRKSIHELISFLSLMPVGQAFALNPGGHLLLTGFSPTHLQEYYRAFEKGVDASAKEKEQDLLFRKTAKPLTTKNLSLKIYSLHTKQLNRSLRVQEGSILYSPVPEGEKAPVLIASLVHF